MLRKRPKEGEAGMSKSRHTKAQMIGDLKRWKQVRKRAGARGPGVWGC